MTTLSLRRLTVTLGAIALAALQACGAPLQAASGLKGPEAPVLMSHWTFVNGSKLADVSWMCHLSPQKFVVRPCACAVRFVISALAMGGEFGSTAMQERSTFVVLIGLCEF